MRRSILLLLFLGSLYGGARSALAQCTCAPEYRNITPHKEFNLADVVFVGRVVEIKKTAPDKVTGSYVETVKFEVTRAWKRDSEALVVITGKVHGCANGFEEDEEWLVYAYKQRDGTLDTGCCCSRTSLLAKAAEDLEEFEAKGLQPAKIKRPRE